MTRAANSAAINGNGWKLLSTSLAAVVLAIGAFVITHTERDGHRVMVERVEHVEEDVADVESDIREIKETLKRIERKLD